MPTPRRRRSPSIPYTPGRAPRRHPARTATRSQPNARERRTLRISRSRRRPRVASRRPRRPPATRRVGDGDGVRRTGVLVARQQHADRFRSQLLRVVVAHYERPALAQTDSAVGTGRRAAHDPDEPGSHRHSQNPTHEPPSIEGAPVDARTRCELNEPSLYSRTYTQRHAVALRVYRKHLPVAHRREARFGVVRTFRHHRPHRGQRRYPRGRRIADGTQKPRKFFPIWCGSPDGFVARQITGRGVVGGSGPHDDEIASRRRPQTEPAAPQTHVPLRRRRTSPEPSAGTVAELSAARGGPSASPPETPTSRSDRPQRDRVRGRRRFGSSRRYWTCFPAWTGSGAGLTCVAGLSIFWTVRPSRSSTSTRTPLPFDGVIVRIVPSTVAPHCAGFRPLGSPAPSSSARPDHHECTVDLDREDRGVGDGRSRRRIDHDEVETGAQIGDQLLGMGGAEQLARVRRQSTGRENRDVRVGGRLQDVVQVRLTGEDGADPTEPMRSRYLATRGRRRSASTRATE